MAELSNLLNTDDQGDSPRCEVSVDMLDFEYINQCKDVDKMKAIVDVLKSGKEGYYPDLQKVAEDKMLSLLPDAERKKLMRLQSSATPIEIADAEEEILSWQSEIISTDKKLSTKVKESSQQSSNTKMPAVRGTKNEKIDSISSSSEKKSAVSAAVTNDEKPKAAKQRLSGYDFQAWERYNIDDAISQIDAEDEKMNEESRRIAAESARTLLKRKEKHKLEMEKLYSELNIMELSEEQRNFKAGREKLKGNESFKAGEFEEALLCYSRSIALNPSVPQVYANRAAVYLKMNKFDLAEDDCSRALGLDNQYVKAFSRRGTVRFKLGKYAESIRDFIEARRLDPENQEILNLLKKSEDKYRDVEGVDFYKRNTKNEGNPPKRYASTTKNSSTAITFISSEDEWKKNIMELTERYPLSLLSEGKCVVRESGPVHDFHALNSDTNYDNARNSSSTGFDSSSSSSSSSGLNGFTRISISSDDENDENDDDKKALNSEEPSLLPGFTRISIIDDDDDDEEEESDDEGDKNAGIHKNIPSDAKSSEFTRINICDDDDDDDSDEGNSLGSSQSPPAANASSSNNVAINDSVESAETSEWAIESLRTEALQCIADGKADKAIQALEKAIKLSETDAKQGSISSSLLILLASAQSAAGDDNAAVCTCTRVLSADKRNYKALMRRAEAYFRLNNISAAQTDVFNFLRFEPTNSEALSLADSISQILESQKTDQLSAGNDVGNVISSGGIIEVQEASSTAGKSSKEPSNNGIGSSSSSSSSSSAEDESEQLKTLGNDAMKVQNYADAVRFYTQAIQKNPSNILAVSNRSQAFLKLSKYEEAIKDATEVINFVDQNISSSSTSNGSTNATNATKAKALFRRGSAYRGINTTDSLQLALLDFSNLLALEPNNKEAASEKLRTEKLVKERQQVQSTVKSDKKKSTASEVSSSPSPAPSLSSSSSSFAPGMTEVKSVRKAATASSDDKPIASAVKGEEPFAQENKAQEASKPDTSAPSKKKPVSSGRASIPVKEPSLPSELPKTVYELERVWRGLKSRPDLFVQYVSSFKKNTFKKVFTDSASPDLLSSVFLAMNEHLIRSDISEISETNVNDAVHILSGLGGINKFDLTLSLLPEEDIANIKSVLNKLSGTSFVDKSLIERLRELYKV